MSYNWSEQGKRLNNALAHNIVEMLSEDREYNVIIDIVRTKDWICSELYNNLYTE